MGSAVRTIFAIALSAIVLVGCAQGTYIYRPAQQATATVGNLPAARYAIPPERPTGEVLIASSGLTELPGAASRTPALFVRMIVTNNSDDTAWVMDTQQQAAIIAGQKQAPAHVNTFNQPGPSLEIPRGEKRVVDLYYRLPGKVDGEAAGPQFDVAWNVQTGARLIAERTSFDRTSVEPVYVSDYYYPYGYWGPYYWHDPLWWPYPYSYGSVYLGGPRYYGVYRGYGYHGGYVRGPYIRAAPSRR
jgi:hypothetical protein